MKKAKKLRKPFFYLILFQIQYRSLYKRFVDKNKKPPEPYEVYCGGILLYTVHQWRWIEAGSPENKVLKVGWFGITTHNYEHPLKQYDLQKLSLAQEEIQGRKKISKADLDKIIFY